MNQTKKPNLFRVVVWIVYFGISLILAGFAGGFALLTSKPGLETNIPVLIIAGLIALFSIVRIYFELRTAKVKSEPEVSIEEIPNESELGKVVEEEIKICIHCGKAEPLDTVYCALCGNRFPDRQ